MVEHVAAPPGTVLAAAQRVLHPAWRWAFEGCDLRRDTGGLLRGAGFASVELERYRLGSLFRPVDDQVAGVATA